MNGKAHQEIGQWSGLVTSLVRNRNEEDWIRILIRAAASWYGGRWGAQLPDMVEPATNGRYHRDLFHSVTAAGVTVHKADLFLSVIEAEGKRIADSASADADRALAEGSLVGWILSTVAWLIAEALVGIAQGLIAGYLSHLAADFTTKQCIPVLCADERKLFAKAPVRRRRPANRLPINSVQIRA